VSTQIAEVGIFLFLHDLLYAGFFLTSAVEKTKTQAQNSSQKLKKKTQALGGFFQKLKKVKKITQI